MIRDLPGMQRYRSGKRALSSSASESPPQKKRKKNEAVDGMVRRRQRRWYWVVGESQMMRGEESQWLGFGRLGGAITHSTYVKAALLSIIP